jgi:hypothetical protein
MTQPIESPTEGGSVGPWTGLEQPKKKTKGPGRGGHAKKQGIRQHKPDLRRASCRGAAWPDKNSSLCADPPGLSPCTADSLAPNIAAP